MSFESHAAIGNIAWNILWRYFKRREKTYFNAQTLIWATDNDLSSSWDLPQTVYG